MKSKHVDFYPHIAFARKHKNMKPKYILPFIHKPCSIIHVFQLAATNDIRLSTDRAITNTK